MNRLNSTGSIVLLTFLLFVSGCQSQNVPTDEVTVNGLVQVMGNEPFTAVILQTTSSNSYILKMSNELRQSFLTPARLRVVGRVYLDDWNGKPWAHIEVKELRIID